MPGGTRRLRLFAGTWNVNGRNPEEQLDLSPWLLPPEDAGPCDVYMLGFQEIQVLVGVDAVRTDSSRAEMWRTAVGRVLEPLGFFLVAYRQLVGILIIVFAKLVHKPFISSIAVTCAGTGFLNTLGNKGAVAARFKLYDRELSCVACHLAAHDNNIDRRNQDFRDVVRKAVFPSNSLSDSPLERFDSISDSASSCPPQQNESFPHDPSFSSKPIDLIRKNAFPNSKSGPGSSQVSSSILPQNAATNWIGSFAAAAAAMYMENVNPNPAAGLLADPNAINILDHDAVFWLGDLNYRIDAPSERVLEWIERQDWESLRDADQLTRQMRLCPTFRDFYEGPIRFPPTYKLDCYEDVYSRDEMGSLKRTPAYTDRILWRKGFPEASPASKPELELSRYSSASVFSSDHRPVSASFVMKFFDEDPDEPKVFHEKNMDETLKAATRPSTSSQALSIRLSVRVVSLGTVYFERCSNAKLVVTNDGKVPVTVSLSTSEFPPWLSLQDSTQRFSASLQPGQSTALRFQALVTASTGCSAAMGSGESALETTLYLDVNRGSGPKEKFEVKGRYMHTCLGSTLAILSMHAEAMRAIPRNNPCLTLSSNDDRDTNGTVGRHGRGHSGSQLASIEHEREQRAEPGLLPLCLPKEIWWLVDLLWRERRRVSDDRQDDGDFRDTSSFRWIESDSRLFLASGDLTLVEKVQDCVDNGQPAPSEVDAAAAASCLLRLLRSLEEPVIPFGFYDAAIDAAKKRDVGSISLLLTRIPAVNANVFRYVLNLLLEMPSIRDGSGLQEISEIFGEALIAPNPDRSGRDLRERATFVRLSLQNSHDVIPRVAVIDLAKSSLTVERGKASHLFGTTSCKSHRVDAVHEQSAGTLRNS